ncbi:protein-S-isoprenylcysteine O-methyltransferase B-like isoform X2 [Benincasa hispida]|uniref:protein-S-isoprenylcysteine O-methyltransferase B-like isoform X2 n=1 Tax=Benincasa hispida TaxID=102211 RepID=UPI001900047B|nr:protein-S-isoprenylcysteine O-methyltransferase B-like isoform X2 [Benincasa hispida]
MSISMLCIKDLQRFVHKNFCVLVLYGSASFSEIFSYTACRHLSQMMFAIIFFHSSEYILAVGIHGRSNVTLTSLLISKNYLLAMILSFLEYFLEIILCPSLKEYWWVSQTGLAMVVVGEIIRKLAIITAGRCFTHRIKIYHEDHHKLVTHGVYSFVRHPGYSGFLVWAVGTQIMLCNPFSTIAFAVVVWHFFAERIPYEEYFLRQFFGHEYEEYANQVPSGVPFVK